MNLLDVTKFLPQADEKLVIYATHPWTPESEAIFAWFPDEIEAADYVDNMPLFRDVREVKGFLDRWIKAEKPSIREQCEVLISYASGPAWANYPPPKRS